MDRQIAAAGSGRTGEARDDELVLRVSDVRKSFRGPGRTKVTAVDGVSFSVARGEVLGLLGPNGAGKTTTIKMACGLVHPDSGAIEVAGHDTRTSRLSAARHVAAVLEGNRNLYWRLSVLENLVYFGGNRGRAAREVKGRARELLERFGLAEKSDEVVAKLSRGMQQKLAIAVALLADTDLLVLDEPTLGLDVETGYEVRSMLKDIAAEGRTVVLSTHDMPVVEELCERVVVVSGGRVVTDALVPDLLQLFRSRAFEVVLAEPLAPADAARIRAAFFAQFAEDGSFQVELPAASELYALVDLLRAAGADVVSIDRTTVRFEEVFRRLVKEGGLPTSSDAGTGPTTVPASRPLRPKEVTVVA